MYSATVLAVTLLLAPLIPAPAPTVANHPPVVAVNEHRLVDGDGDPIQLRGVNRSGAEYSCVQGHGIFDGGVHHEDIAAMKSWQINTVRVPLNEDCWLGAGGLDPASSGSSYRDAIAGYVDRLTRAGLVVIVDLHWTGTSTDLARGQQPMARVGRSEEFWRSVAGVFHDQDGVLFDVFNEPHDINWDCWRNGCGGYAGMQDLVDAIRSTGARQPIVVSGLDWGGDLRRWHEFQPHDPLDALVAGAHLYDFKRCVTPDCWDAEIAPVAAETPVIITEFGDSDCDGDFSGSVMSWADSTQVSYVAWTWNPWDCNGGPSLIDSFNGSPSRYGQVVKDRFRARVPPAEVSHRMPGGATPV